MRWFLVYGYILATLFFTTYMIFDYRERISKLEIMMEILGENK